jgi:hypothetical protein
MPAIIKFLALNVRRRLLRPGEMDMTYPVIFNTLDLDTSSLSLRTAGAKTPFQE